MRIFHTYVLSAYKHYCILLLNIFMKKPNIMELETYNTNTKYFKTFKLSNLSIMHNVIKIRIINKQVVTSLPISVSIFFFITALTTKNY